MSRGSQSERAQREPLDVMTGQDWSFRRILFEASGYLCCSTLSGHWVLQRVLLALHNNVTNPRQSEVETIH